MIRLPHGGLFKILIIMLLLNVFLIVKFYPPHKHDVDGTNTPPPNFDAQKTKPNEISNCPHEFNAGSQVTQSFVNLEHVEHENNISKLSFAHVDIRYGRWDSQLEYTTKDFAEVGDEYVESSKMSLICLATQSSVERLYSLPQVAANWNGPLSIALFSAGNEEFVILKYFVTFMRLCFPNIKSNATFHISAPEDYESLPQVSMESLNIKGKFNCRNPDKTLKFLLRMRTAKTLDWRRKNVYPQNHLRNIARKGCQTKYVFLTDIDIIPSVNSVSLLNDFFRNVSCKKNCAYVIPTFEIDFRATFPQTKENLLALVKRGLARPFHEKVFIYNQYATNFSKWKSLKRNDTAVVISHIVTNFEFLYEPFYIATDNVPMHDERFTGYGFTRNSQVYEMYMAGYNFYVLSPVFTCHWGLQRKQARPAWREQQNNANRKKFEIFKSEIFARYKNDPHVKIN